APILFGGKQRRLRLGQIGDRAAQVRRLEHAQGLLLLHPLSGLGEDFRDSSGHRRKDVGDPQIVERHAPGGPNGPPHRPILDRFDGELTVLHLLRRQPNFAREYLVGRLRWRGPAAASKANQTYQREQFLHLLGSKAPESSYRQMRVILPSRTSAISTSRALNRRLRTKEMRPNLSSCNRAIEYSTTANCSTPPAFCTTVSRSAMALRIDLNRRSIASLPRTGSGRSSVNTSTSLARVERKADSRLSSRALSIARTSATFAVSSGVPPCSKTCGAPLEMGGLGSVCSSGGPTPS